MRKLDLWNFKAFDRFTLTLGSSAFLVGPNSAGKSTLIAAIRVAASMSQHATRRKVSGARRHEQRNRLTHNLRADQFGVVTENLRHQFRDVETSFRVETDERVRLTAVWPEGDLRIAEPFFFLEDSDGSAIKTPGVAKTRLGTMGIIPLLSPLRQVETVRERDYMRQNVERTLSSQHARNHLLALSDDGEFESFKDYVLEWLPELDDINVKSRRPPDFGDMEIDVYIRERGDRIHKELFWAGDGIQIFVQVLFHTWRLQSADVVVLDEPDLYLHADLQRRLVRLLESMECQTITATHSSEMLAEAASDSVVWVDKSRKRGVRRPDAATLEDLSTEIGSNFNLRLAAALRARTVVFVEGQDMSIIRAIAKAIGATNLAGEKNCAVIELQGFSNWGNVKPFQWFVSDFLENSVDVFLLLDRDYYSDDRVVELTKDLGSVGVRPHVWEKKEIENYLLVPRAIARISGLDFDAVDEIVDGVTEGMTEYVLGQFIGQRQATQRRTGKDPASIAADVLQDFGELSKDPKWRLARYPAKRILAAVNQDIQSRGLRTVSFQALAKRMSLSEIDDELIHWVSEVELSASGIYQGPR